MFFQNAKVSKEDLVKLVMLYALRYQTSEGNQTPKFLNMLKDKGCSEADVRVISH